MRSVITIGLLAGWGALTLETASGADATVQLISPSDSRGGRVCWSHALSRIAFDRRGADNYYDICTMNPDGSDVQPLTEAASGLPTKHVGQPAWHPSGEYILFQAQKMVHAWGTLVDVLCSPGAGTYNDLWVINVNTKQVWKVWNVGAAGAAGTLHPHFNHAGTKISWSQLYDSGTGQPYEAAGIWRLIWADFALVDGVPQMSNVQQFEPGTPAFVENHGFMPDGRILFSANFATAGISVFERSDIYAVDINTLALTRLTDSDYNEHAHASRDGSKIVWMSNLGLAEAGENSLASGTDFFMMNPDGSGKERLTYFNDPAHPHYREGGAIAADLSWGSNSKRFAGYVQAGQLGQGNYKEEIFIVTLPNQAPVVTAGADQTIALPASASLAGTVSDDGLPDPPGAVTMTWTKEGGPGTVTFGNSGEAATTASFSEAGTYVLRLTANDGALTSSNIVTITANDPPVASDQAVSTRKRTPVAIILAATDLEGAALTYSIVTPPRGSLSGTAPNLIYTPRRLLNSQRSIPWISGKS